MSKTRKTKTRARDLSALPLIPYVRVSRIGGRKGESYISKPEQMRACRAIATQLGVELLPPLEDEDRSGGNVDRPEFQRALQMIRDGLAGGIVVKTLDRFSRDTIDGLSVLEEIEDQGGSLHPGDGPITLRTPNERTMATIRFAIATGELGNKREGLMDAVRNAVERGVHLSIPFGYQRADGKGTKLEPTPFERDAVRLAYELRADGCSWGVIARRLNDYGVPPRPFMRDGVPHQGQWRDKSVMRMVKNEVYIGVAYSGEHRTEGAHEPLVSLDLFRRANRTKGTRPARNEEGHLLSGLVRCVNCGYVMAVNHVSGRRYYACRASAGRVSDPCSRPTNVPADALEAWVLDEFCAEFIDVELEGRPSDSSLIDALTKLDRAKARLTRALDASFDDEASADEREVLDDAVERARLSVRRASEAVTRARLDARGVDLPLDLEADTVRELPIADARHLLTIVYGAIVVRPAATFREPAAERACIVPRDESPDDRAGMILLVRGIDVL